MPIIANTSASAVRLVNQAFAAAFFPRANQSVYSKICRSYTQRSETEPFSVMGSPPILTQFSGTVDSNDIASFTWTVPNQIFKNFEQISRNALETDQTGTLIKRVAVNGQRLAQWQDQLFFTKLITGNRTASATEVSPSGTSYNVTIDGLPFFSAVHSTGPSGVTQSNIVNGNLASTVATMAANDLGASAQAMQKDMILIQQRFAQFQDTVGSVLLSDSDMASRIILLVPPSVKPIADLAFRSPGAMIGGSPGNSGSTGSTTFQHSIVREVISSNYLASMRSSIDGSVLTGTSATEYYAFLVDDYVAPMYWQRFLPLGINGVNTDAVANAVMAAGNAAGINTSFDSAALYATMEVDNNFGALGSQAQESVVKQEKFFVSARARGNFAYGFPYTALKIVPSGASS